MVKYATYNVFQNVETKEIKRIPFTDEVEMTKLANLAEWKLLDNDPEDLNETKEHKIKES